MKKVTRQEIAEVVQWLNTYANKSGRKAWVVGVSGGVDSACVSTLCAMTGIPTHCVLLPCQTKGDQTVRGETHIEWLKDRFGDSTVNVVHRHYIDLTTTFEAFKKETMFDHDNTLGYANTKSRLRMTALYQVATGIDGLVVGTGNKVEDVGIRFFTKYGDGGVDISPIADFMKSEVRKMCRLMGVLPELSEAVPTDGLWDDTRTDETAIGATYDELEWAMKFMEDGKNCYSTVLVEGLTERQKKVLEIYNTRHAVGAHKLAPIPTFIRQCNRQ